MQIVMRKFSTKKIRAKIDHIILTEQKIASSLKKNSKKYIGLTEMQMKLSKYGNAEQN